MEMYRGGKTKTSLKLIGTVYSNRRKNQSVKTLKKITHRHNGVPLTDGLRVEVF